MSTARTHARYEGFCRTCDEPFPAGSVIYKLAAGWSCTACRHGWRPAPAPRTSLSSWPDALFTACPESQRQKVYRALALAFHPDTGGDQRAMVEIIAAFERHQPR